ncbi:MAG: ABC transporter [Desulfobulbus propionicus]|nr:MAG: ABC transporter [Desulfobulbus propionicus]
MSTSREEETPLLSCRDLKVNYQKTAILHGISLDFYKGHFIALLGKNGAGKTTLLSSLMGLLPSTAAKLEICGLNPLTASRADIARRVSFVPQEHEEMFPFSVLDVVVMGRTAYLGPFGSPREADFILCRQVLEELHLTHLTTRTYPTLSGGEKQMVLLARALVQTRTMVFLDEPTNHLDYKNRYTILAILKQQCLNNDSCIVACLHDPNHARIFADQVIMIDNGRVLAQGATTEVLTGAMISRLYGLAVASPNTSFEPCFSQSLFAGKVLLLVGASGAGKTTTLERLIKTTNSLKIDGIVCPGTWKNNRRFSSTARRIATGEEAPFASRSTDNEASPFIFHDEGKTLAEKALQAEQHYTTDCLIIDEIGPLEMDDGGFAPYLPALLSLKNTKHIWAVRPSLVDHVCSKWLLVEPVQVAVDEEGALAKMQKFLDQ